MNVLMIGLDGATFTLLDPMMRSGVMPYLRSVVERGVRAELMSTRHPLTPPAWTSMITGRSPEAHGIYDFLRPAFMADGGVFLKINDFRDNHCETVVTNDIVNLNETRLAPNGQLKRYTGASMRFILRPEPGM